MALVHTPELIHKQFSQSKKKIKREKNIETGIQPKTPKSCVHIPKRRRLIRIASIYSFAYQKKTTVCSASPTAHNLASIKIVVVVIIISLEIFNETKLFIFSSVQMKRSSVQNEMKSFSLSSPLFILYYFGCRL